MSPLDALLLDPFPLETFVAYRTDGIAGSGTANDPWNAATKWGPSLVINSLIRSGLEATATFYPEPGVSLAEGNFVTISADTHDSQNWNETFYKISACLQR